MAFGTAVFEKRGSNRTYGSAGPTSNGPRVTDTRDKRGFSRSRRVVVLSCARNVFAKISCCYAVRRRGQVGLTREGDRRTCEIAPTACRACPPRAQPPSRHARSHPTRGGRFDRTSVRRYTRERILCDARREHTK